MGLGIVGSGLLVYAYLAIIARSVSAAEYAYFGAFWSLALVAGFGVFLPIEQETARLMQVPDRPRGLLRAALLTALPMAGVQVALVAVASLWLVHVFGGHPVTVVAFALLCLVSAGQFVVRGALIGMDRMDRYARDHGGRHGAARRVRRRGRAARGRSGQPRLRVDAAGGDRVRTRPAALPARHPPYPVGRVPRLGPDTITPRDVRRAVAPLLLGSLCAQLLLNGPPVLVPALAQNELEVTRAGQFLAAFTLARVPLFLVVPLQTALLPMLTGVLHSGDRTALRRVLVRLSVGLAVLGAVALALGYLVGPLMVGLIFGDQYVLGGRDVALLAVGVAVHIGLILVTQVLVASVPSPAGGVELADGCRRRRGGPPPRPRPAARRRAGVPRRLDDRVAGRNPAGPHHRTTRARAAACLTPLPTTSPSPSRTTPRTSRA